LPRGENNACNDNRQFRPNKEINMKKIVIAVLTLVGLAALIAFVAKHLSDD